LIKIPFDICREKLKNKTNINTIIDCTLTKNFPKGQWIKITIAIVDEVTVLNKMASNQCVRGLLNSLAKEYKLKPNTISYN
jgi:hypothetical protein